MYSTTAADRATNALLPAVQQTYRDPGGHTPDWAFLEIVGLYQTGTWPNDNSWGNDYLAGGAANDMIFGQLGNDVIQGDGSIDYAASGCSAVGATWNADTSVSLCPSRDNVNGTDGSDYVEGGGGNDVIFGNQGQDDLIGGNSNPNHFATPVAMSEEIARQIPDARLAVIPGAAHLSAVEKYSEFNALVRDFLTAG